MPLTGAGSVEGQHRRGRWDAPLTRYGAGSQTDNSAALFVHKAQSTAVPVGLRSVVLAARPRRSARQRGGDHELRALGVEPSAVAGVGWKTERERGALLERSFARHGRGLLGESFGVITGAGTRGFRRPLPFECHYFPLPSPPRINFDGVEGRENIYGGRVTSVTIREVGAEGGTDVPRGSFKQIQTSRS